MATTEEYERVLAKAEMMGLKSLNSQEKELLKKMVNQMGELGNRARRVLNGN